MGPRKNGRGPIAVHYRVPEIQAPGWFPGGDPERGPRKYGVPEWGMGRESAGPAKAGPRKQQEMGLRISGALSGEWGGPGRGILTGPQIFRGTARPVSNATPSSPVPAFSFLTGMLV